MASPQNIGRQAGSDRIVAGKRSKPDTIRRYGSLGPSLLPDLVAVARSQNSDFYSSDRKSTRLNSSHRCISYAVTSPLFPYTTLFRSPVQYEFEIYDIWHRRRILDVKPGVTGLWQVSGRSRTRFDDMVRLDLRYCRTWSLWLDLKILISTPQIGRAHV